MRDLGWGDDRWFQRFWRFADVDAARALRFPESGPGRGDDPAARLAQIVDHLRETDLTYSWDPPFHSPGGQMVRTPSELAPRASATCIDVVALTTAACTLSGLHSWAVVSTTDTSGSHVWVVVDVSRDASWEVEVGHDAASERFLAWEQARMGRGEVEDADDLRALVAGGGAIPLDPTRLCSGYRGEGPTDPFVGWDDLAGDACTIEVCDVGHWWSARWLHRPELSPVDLAWVPRRDPVPVAEPPARPRPVLDRRCDEWLDTGGPGLLLVGHGGRGVTTALRRLVTRAAATADVLVVAASPWNAGRWLDYDGGADGSVTSDFVGRRLLRALAVQWDRETGPRATADVQAVNASLYLPSDPWTSVEEVLARLGPGRELLVVVDGLDPGWVGHDRDAMLSRIRLLHDLGHRHPHPLRRRLRVLVAGERDPMLVDQLGTLDTIDLDEVDQDPAEVAVRAEALAAAPTLPLDVTPAGSTWAEIAFWSGTTDSGTDRGEERMQRRLARLRHRRVPADSLLAVLLAAAGPLPRRSLADIAELGSAADELVAIAQPWLVGDAAQPSVELHSAARRWLLSEVSTSGLVAQGHRRLALACLDAVRAGDGELTRYADHQLVDHVVHAGPALDRSEVDALVERTWAQLSDPTWQERLAYLEGPAQANARWCAWAGRLDSGRADRPIWHDTRTLAGRPPARLRLSQVPRLLSERSGAVFRAAGGDGRGRDTIAITELGLRIGRTERDGGVVVDVQAPRAWRGTFVHLTVLVAADGSEVEVLVPLTDADVPRGWVELLGQTLTSHDLELGSPLSVTQVALLDPDLLDRSRYLPQSSRSDDAWAAVDLLRAP